MMGTSAPIPRDQGKKFVFRALHRSLPGRRRGTYAVKTLGMKKAALLVDVANDYCVGSPISSSSPTISSAERSSPN